MSLSALVLQQLADHISGHHAAGCPIANADVQREGRMHGPTMLTICDETSTSALQNKQQRGLGAWQGPFTLYVYAIWSFHITLGAMNCSTPPPKGSILQLYAEPWQRALDVQKSGGMKIKGP